MSVDKDPFPTLIVKEMEPDQTNLRIDYFHNASADYLERLGVDPQKLPSRAEWQESLEEDFTRPLHQRKSFNLVWLLDDHPVGMSSIDQLDFGEQGMMHLHIFDSKNRRQGMGTEAIKKSTKLYFQLLDLRRIFCQPNAYNSAPHRALQKAGFDYVETIETIPGPINFFQPVTRWKLDRP